MLAFTVPPSAHFGHWYVGLLYLAPVAILVGVLVVQGRRDRRAEAAELAAEAQAAADSPQGCGEPPQNF